MFRKPGTLAIATISAAAISAATLLLGPTPAASAAEDPWGPTHVLYDGSTSPNISQATTSDGTTVVVFRQFPHRHEPSVAMVAIRPSGGEWSEPVPLMEGKRAARAKVIAWGDGQLSIIWTSATARDNVQYTRRSLTAEGTLGAPEELIKAKDASTEYRAAINSSGQLALAWSDRDKFDRMAVRDVDGTWRRYPPAPVFHLGQWQLDLPEPRALFLDDAGRASLITWGTVGKSQPTIWLATSGPNKVWATQRIEPVTGWIPNSRAAYASNARGDLVTITGTRDAAGGWSARLRFAPAGGRLGPPTTLTEYGCWQDDGFFCSGAAVADDGTVTVAYPRYVGDDKIVLEVTRRSPDGTLSAPQQVTDPFWENAFHGVQVIGNGRGDTVLSFLGGAQSGESHVSNDDHSGVDHSGVDQSGVGAIRCPAASPCVESTYGAGGSPGLWRLWTTTMGEDAEVTFTWSIDEYGRDEGTSTRQLAAVG